MEVRYAGVDILADPGSHRDYPEPAWRSNQIRRVRAREIEVIDDGDIASWTAEHDDCASLDPSARIVARSCWTGRHAASTSLT